jgi:hypothetical protein
MNKRPVVGRSSETSSPHRREQQQQQQFMTAGAVSTNRCLSAFVTKKRL